MANPTSNFGWQMPTNTDLVKDLPADFEVFGQAVDTSLMDLKGGTTGQVLSKASNTDMDFTWTNVDPLTILDAKGDLISATAADTPARLASSGVNGDVLTVDTTTATGLKWAAPASGSVSFTNRLEEGTGQINTIAYNGSNLYVAAGSGGKLYTSSDGKTWTSRTSGFGANGIQRVAFGNGLWVAVGDNGTITTSSDGTTWTARTANMSTNGIRDVIYANSTWVAVGAGGGSTNTGGITYSTDGITWTRKSQTPTIGTTYYGIIWNGTNYVIAAGLSTNNLLYASSASGTWTATVVGSQTLVGIWYDGTRQIVAPNDYTWRYSTSTTWATSTTIDSRYNWNQPSPNVNNTTIYNNKLYSVYGIAAAGSIAPYFMLDFSTTPSTADSTYFKEQGNPVSFPANYYTSPTAMFVGAAGRILAINQGIYTSF